MQGRCFPDYTPAGIFAVLAEIEVHGVCRGSICKAVITYIVQRSGDSAFWQKQSVCCHYGRYVLEVVAAGVDILVSTDKIQNGRTPKTWYIQGTVKISVVAGCTVLGLSMMKCS